MKRLPCFLGWIIVDLGYGVKPRGGEPVEETIALIDKIIGEHKIITQRVQTLEQVANDAEAMVGLEKAKEAFMPGRFEQKQGLQKLQELLDTIEQGLQAHFNREETALLTAFEKHGDKELVSTLRSLLLEHEGLRNRFAHSRKHITELTSGGLSRHVWEASAHDMRAHISHTRKLLEAHAEIEQELLQELRSELIRREKGND
jgi:regulator of sigma D